jgi:hypothetical protein
LCLAPIEQPLPIAAQLALRSDEAIERLMGYAENSATFVSGLPIHPRNLMNAPL